jgi:HD-like signal output (HDOD) protein
MFKSLIKVIFPSVSSGEIAPNFEYFQQTKLNPLDEDERTNVITHPRNQSENINDENIKKNNYEKLFYDLLFGEETQLCSLSVDPLSEYIASQINDLLLRPQNLMSELPIMPASVNAVLTALNNNNFNLKDIITIIEKEPIMAADTIKLANSAKYRRSKEPVINLKSAFMNMGSQGLMEGVIYVFIDNFTPKNSPYFKHFGDKIWQHSLQTAIISKALAENNSDIDSPDVAYLIGLLRNLGGMIIFDLMVEAFNHVDPCATPSSKTFKVLIAKHAISLTLAIVSKWNLPPLIIETINQQNNKFIKKSPLSELIEQANFISELQSLYQYKKVNQQEYKLACEENLTCEQALTYAIVFLSQE